jgi:S-methylmethionine-dependent homocysteine/selenocysteine methylase
MPRYRDQLPQLGDRLFLTDGGIETTLIFHDGLDLPDFAAFDLLERPEGELALVKYFLSYTAFARQHRSGLVLESATWRANADWGTRLGYDAVRLARANRLAIRMLERLRHEVERDSGPIAISGCIGPRGDGYVPANAMSAAEAESYHAAQIATFASTNADLVTAITMNYVEEAIGVARAARRAGMPAVISFTVETDGNLPTGQPLAEAIRQVDRETDGAPAYYMINCAHPTHFAETLDESAPWAKRLRGLRANASCRSHAELNEAPDLDIGNPEELARDYAAIHSRLPWLNVFGGCCGTDHRHVDAIARAVAPRFARHAA